MKGCLRPEVIISGCWFTGDSLSWHYIWWAVPTLSRLWSASASNRSHGSIRRECLDHCIVLNERHLRRILTDYFDYYHHACAHLSLNHNSPVARDVEPPDRGSVIAIPHVGGLHHRYRRAA